jgi:hypothetical protein
MSKHKHPLSPLANAANAALMVLVAIPAVWFGHHAVHHACPALGPAAQAAPVQWLDASKWLTMRQWCALAALPVHAVNVLFFLNGCVLFWLISLAQKSTWVRCRARQARHGARRRLRRLLTRRPLWPPLLLRS